MRSIASIAAGAAFVLGISTALAQPEQPPPGDKPAGVEGDQPQAPPKQITDKDLATAQQEDARPWAKGVTPEEQRKALALFNEANGMLRDALFPKAAEKYREALTHWDHPAIHYNLALALVNLDQPVEMDAALEKALIYGAAPLGEDKFDRAKDFKLLVEKQLVKVEYTLNEPDSILIIDGKEVQKGPGTYSALVRAGEHSIAARAPGYSPTQLNLKLGGGETSRLELKLFTDAELTREKRKMPSWVPWSVVGAGVVFGGVGALMHTSAKNGFADYDQAISDCAAVDPTGGCADPSPATFALKSSAESKQTLAATFYVVAGLTVGAGVALVVINRPKTYRIDPLEKLDAGGGVSITPVFGPDNFGVAAAGRF
jgi:hypothetical protein